MTFFADMSFTINYWFKDVVIWIWHNDYTPSSILADTWQYLKMFQFLKSITVITFSKLLCSKTFLSFTSSSTKYRRHILPNRIIFQWRRKNCSLSVFELFFYLTYRRTGLSQPSLNWFLSSVLNVVFHYLQSVWPMVRDLRIVVQNTLSAPSGRQLSRVPSINQE